ncbi:MAG: phosphoglycerate dehydrogenase [Calditrichia bacterium]
MKNDTPIGVASRSFSKHPILRAELEERYSNVKFNDEGLALKGETFIDFVRGRRKMITALETIDEAFLSAVPELEVISKYGVGTDMLDKQAMIKHGVRLGWCGGVNKRSVTELVIAFMTSLLHLVPQLDRELRAGTWKNRKGRCLTGRTVGIIGCGHVGKDLTTILKAFGCKVLAHDILDFPEFYAEYDVEAVDLETLLKRSDVVTLHVPLDKSTRLMLNADRLALMREDAILVNAARGGLVDEQALKQMLKDGRLAGAALDVFDPEPPVDQELLCLPNFLATPHIGGSSEEAILAMGRSAIAGLDDNTLPSENYPPAG